MIDRLLKPALCASLALLALGLFGIAAAQPRIAVTIHPLLDLTQRIAGPDAHVVRLLPPGASPHTFDPSPSVVAEVERADLVILIGGIDAWALELMESGGDAAAVLELLPLYENLERLVEPEGEHHEGEGETDRAEGENEQHDADEVHHDDEEHHDDQEHAEGEAHDEHADHGHEGVNPHIWLDPVLMEQAVGSIAVRLAELDPERAETYRQNAAELVTQLRGLHGELQLILAPVRGAPFIPFHDAWPYFATRYELDLVMEIEPFPGREPGPRYLATVVGAIRSSGTPAIFAEAQLGERPARVIADEAGVEVATLDPIGGVEGRNSYEELLRHNAQTIVDALRAP